MKKWINDNGEIYNGKYVIVGERKYISPSESKLAELGYHKVEPQVIEPTIDDLTQPYKDALASEDYKVIKCMEAFLRGKPLPYDIDLLGEARDALRDNINEIERSGEQE